MNISPTNNYTPAFGSSNLLNKAGQFAKKQALHVFVQSACWTGAELTSPSPNLKHLLIRKISVDSLEVIANALHKVKTTGNSQCTNVFAWLLDGARAVGKMFNKRK